MFISQLIIGAALIILTVVIHAVVLDRIIHILEKLGPLLFQHFQRLWKVPTLILAVLGVFGVNIVLGQDWWLISSFQAANGFLLFGWGTALIFEIMSKLYKQEFIKATK